MAEFFAVQAKLNKIPDFVSNLLKEEKTFEHAYTQIKEDITNDPTTFDIVCNELCRQWILQCVQMYLNDCLSFSQATDVFLKSCGTAHSFARLYTEFENTWKKLSTPASPVDDNCQDRQDCQDLHFSDACLAVEAAPDSCVNLSLVCNCNNTPIKIPVVLKPEQILQHVWTVINTATLDAGHLPQLVQLSATINDLIVKHIPADEADQANCLPQLIQLCTTLTEIVGNRLTPADAARFGGHLLALGKQWNNITNTVVTSLMPQTPFVPLTPCPFTPCPKTPM